MTTRGLARQIRSRLNDCLKDAVFRAAFVGGEPGPVGAVLARLPWIVATGPTLDERGVALVLAVAEAPALVAFITGGDQLCTLKGHRFAAAVLVARARLTTHLASRQPRARAVLAQLSTGDFAASTIEDGALALMTPVHPSLAMARRRIYLASRCLEAAARVTRTPTHLARLAGSQSDDLGF